MNKMQQMNVKLDEEETVVMETQKNDEPKQEKKDCVIRVPTLTTHSSVKL